MDEKIIQIIPVQNVYAIYKDATETIALPVKCIALTDRGDVKFLDVDSLGWFDFVDKSANFDHFYFPDIDEVERRCKE